MHASTKSRVFPPKRLFCQAKPHLPTRISEVESFTRICALRIEIIMIVENAFGPYFAKCINRNMILACSHPMHENASVSINLVYKLYYCQLTCQNSHPIETQGSQQKGMMGQVRIEYFHFLWAFPPIIHPLCFSQKMAFHALGPLLYIVY